jgi:transcriptional regulator with XRE-family HTH domain
LRLLRQERKATGLNQREVAERLGETTLFVSRCERGERRMDMVELIAYCRAAEIAIIPFMQSLLNAVETNQNTD